MLQSRIKKQKQTISDVELFPTTMKSSDLKLDSKMLVIQFKSMKILSKIGKGGSNTVVFKALWNNVTVAVKLFQEQFDDSKDVYASFHKELSILASLRHPNIVTLYGYTLDYNRVGIVMEYCSGGDLQKYFLYNSRSIQTKLKVMKEISLAFTYLHSNNILHRDLKPQNVLIDDQQSTKLIDFGISKIIDTTIFKASHTRSIGNVEFTLLLIVII
jgi:serine/threonine-protein kinase